MGLVCAYARPCPRIIIENDDETQSVTQSGKRVTPPVSNKGIWALQVENGPFGGA